MNRMDGYGRVSWRRLVSVVICLLTLAATTVSAAEDDKIRLAVVDFDTEAISQNWRYGWNHQRLERAAADNLTSALAESGRFRVIERQQLDKVLAEQNIGDTWRVDPSTAARMGKILGAQLVVMGSVTEFGIADRGGRIPQIGRWKWGRGIGARVVTGSSKLTARLVDTTTGEILGVYKGSGSHTFGKGEFAGAQLGSDWDSRTASKVLAESVEQIAREIADAAGEIEPSTVRGGLEAKIARTDKDKVYLNIGSGSGVKPGDRFEIRAVEDEIVDPDTGESLGGVETAIGIVEISDVINDRLSVARIVMGRGFKVGNRAVMK